jgi:hypothetical protein
MTQSMTKIYKQKPVFYLWPVGIIITLVMALWAQFPLDLKLQSAHSGPPAQRSLPYVAYITIDPGSVNELVKRAASEWMLGAGAKEKRRSRGLDLTTLEASLEAPPPIYLEKGYVIPTEWIPEHIAQLPVDTPPISVPERASLNNPQKVLPQRTIFNVRLSSTLMRAQFQSQFLKDVLKTLSSPSGQCRFYLECDASGDVEHILRLSTATPDASLFERALMLGKTKKKASGWVDIEWMVKK